MKNKLFLFVALALILVMVTVSPVFAQGASECGQGYGALHKTLATTGATGQGPMRGGHVPGLTHGGAAGFCGVGAGS